MDEINAAHCVSRKYYYHISSSIVCVCVCVCVIYTILEPDLSLPLCILGWLTVYNED